MSAALFEGIYARLGRHYLHAWFSLYAIASAGLALVAAVLFSFYVPMDAGRFALTTAVALACLSAALVAGWLRFLADWRLLFAWVAGRRDPAAALEVRRVALTVPVVGVRDQLVLAIALAAAPVAGYVGIAFDLGVLDAALVFLGMVVAGLWPTAAFGLLFEAWLGPIAREASRALPAGAPDPPRTFPLRVRLAAAVPVSSVVTAGFVSVAATLPTDATIADLGRGVAIATAVGLLASLVLVPIVETLVLPQIRALHAAARNLLAGAGDEPVPVLSGDELAELAVSFNEMVATAAERERLRTQAVRLRVEAQERARRGEEDLRRAVLAQREQLALELHGAFSHELDSLLGRAAAATAVLDRGAPLAAGAVADLEDGARELLGELRRFVGVLRAPRTPELEPQPALHDIERVLAAARRAGIEVSAAGLDAPDVPLGLQVSLYRIVEDLVDDALLAGRPGPLQLALAVDDDAVALSVEADAGAGQGAGLVRARDRVALLHGSWDAQALAGRLRVAIRLPSEGVVHGRESVA